MLKTLSTNMEHRADSLQKLSLFYVNKENNVYRETCGACDRR